MYTADPASAISREPTGPGTPPGFDARRRLSDDSHQTHKSWRKPSLDASLGRGGYDSPSPVTKISRKPSLDVTIDRSEYSLFNAKGLARWGSNDSQEQSGSGSESISSSVTSLASSKEVPRYRDLSDVFRDPRVPY